jgi:hypothetical protein
LTENKQIFAKKMDALMKRQDYNLDMYKKLMSTHHKLLLTSQSILQMLLTRQGVHLYTHLDVVIKESHAKEILSDYLMQLKTSKYSIAKEQDFYSMFVVTEKTATYTMLKTFWKRVGLELDRVIVNGRIIMIYT